MLTFNVDSLKLLFNFCMLSSMVMDVLRLETVSMLLVSLVALARRENTLAELSKWDPRPMFTV